MYVNCTVNDHDAAGRTLRVLQELRVYDDPQLWGNISHLVLENGRLNLRGVMKTTDVETLEWFLDSCVANDVRKLQ